MANRVIGSQSLSHKDGDSQVLRAGRNAGAAVAGCAWVLAVWLSLGHGPQAVKWARQLQNHAVAADFIASPMAGSPGWHGGAMAGPQTLKDGSDPKGQGLGTQAVRTRADWLVIALRQMDHL